MRLTPPTEMPFITPPDPRLKQARGLAGFLLGWALGALAANVMLSIAWYSSITEQVPPIEEADELARAPYMPWLLAESVAGTLLALFLAAVAIAHLSGRMWPAGLAVWGWLTLARSAAFVVLMLGMVAASTAAAKPGGFTQLEWAAAVPFLLGTGVGMLLAIVALLSASRLRAGLRDLKAPRR